MLGRPLSAGLMALSLLACSGANDGESISIRQVAVTDSDGTELTSVAPNQTFLVSWNVAAVRPEQRYSIWIRAVSAADPGGREIAFQKCAEPGTRGSFACDNLGQISCLLDTGRQVTCQIAGEERLTTLAANNFQLMFEACMFDRSGNLLCQNRDLGASINLSTGDSSPPPPPEPPAEPDEPVDEPPVDDDPPPDDDDPPNNGGGNPGGGPGGGGPPGRDDDDDEVEEPPVEEEPPVVEEPPAEEEPPVVEEPPVEEEPPVVEEPPAEEEPPVEEEPVVDETGTVEAELPEELQPPGVPVL
ncbi:hypothetical protein QQF73_03390 [Marinobacter sp. M216]|uniref:Fibronectin type-III domain-containing protein n=1 Tax=Marinobacter albus TaxID=3030833 RepID=A0ABT7HAS6_9GAMM|nr:MULTISPECIES: hypothetical protein [unclassified Marinobacter]MBW7471053.1 hypothetical protein [Marinobacter sp. F4218]MDK9556656.1 hypothetical protein [Marinobacter sp. M216]